MKQLFHHCNTYDFDGLTHFMHQNATVDFIFHLKGNNCMDRKERKSYFPRSLTAQGVDPFVKFAATLSECAPDRVYVIKETIIRNRDDCCFILSRFIFSGTLMYHLQIKEPGVNDETRKMIHHHVDKKKRPSISQVPANGRDSNGYRDMDLLREESFNITSSDDPFRVGEMMRHGGMESQNIEGTATLYLNNEGKIRKLEINFTDSRDDNWVKIVQQRSEKK